MDGRITRESFSDFIDSELNNISSDFVELRAGDIHRSIGGLSRGRPQNAGLLCCNA